LRTTDLKEFIKMPTVDWKKAFLKDNPFAGTPPKPGEEIIWAGMEEQRRLIEDRIALSLSTSPYSLILNWGPWGGGKTHAARYFNQEKILASLSKRANVGKPLSIIINVPRGSKDVVKDLYISLLSNIGLKKIREDISKAATALGDKFADTVRAYSGDEELSLALQRLAQTGPGARGDHAERTDIGEVSLPLKRYFFLSAGTSELRELGLGRKIESSNDMIKVLTSILNLVLHSNGNGPSYSEVIVWFDEMEEILSLPGKEQIVLTGLLRDLTDSVPNNLTMFLNFTGRAGGKLEDAGAYLSPAVWDRVRDQVFFDFLTENQIKQYILELLNHPKYRLSEPKKPLTEYFPFDEAAVDYLSHELMAKATPRAINEVCSIVIERALTSGILDRQNGLINAQFLEEINDQIKAITARGGVSSR
jgi:hypothetical protein